MDRQQVVVTAIVTVLAAAAATGVLLSRSRPPPSTVVVVEDDDDDDYLTRRERFTVMHQQQQQQTHKRIPCCLVAGEFGSGKTSLVKHILKELNQDDVKCAVIVNDFCDLEIDVASLRRINDTVYGFSDNCMCCALSNSQGGGATALRRQIEALRRDVQADVLIIELNGLSQVERAVGVVSELTRLDSIVGVVDAATAASPSAVSPAFLATCDVICLNKAGECAESELVAAEQALRQGNYLLDLVRTDWGRIPLDKCFRVRRSDFVVGQMSVREAKQSSCWELVRGGDGEEEAERRRPVLGEEEEAQQQPPHDADVKWRLLKFDRAVSLGELQRRVERWHESSGLRRIKGRVWLQTSSSSPSSTESYEFQFSGRTRLQCTRNPPGVSSQTRLAIVSTSEEDFEWEEAPIPQTTAVDFPDVIDNNRIITILQQEEGGGGVTTFQITCLDKFGFSADVLRQRFGVDLGRVQADFHARFNSAPGPELVALDGERGVLHISGGGKRVLHSAKFLAALQHTVDEHFAVVKHACGCDS